MVGDTSWQKVGNWYNNKVGNEGHFYHQSLIMPWITAWMQRNKVASVLDLACGQGVLERSISVSRYVGVDKAPTLVAEAQNRRKLPSARYIVGDASASLTEVSTQFQAVACILALQNIENYAGVFENVARYCEVGGHFVVVLNHPYYRIPRYSGWSVDPGNGRQTRWVSAYSSEQKIPISMHPGQGSGPVTWSFHVPLATYINALAEKGFALEHMEELSSPKESVGKYAKRENTARNEFPLFMVLVFAKLTTNRL